MVWLLLDPAGVAARGRGRAEGPSHRIGNGDALRQGSWDLLPPRREGDGAMTNQVVFRTKVGSGLWRQPAPSVLPSPLPAAAPAWRGGTACTKPS